MSFLPVKSSNLAGANYDGTSKAFVKFKNGGMYEYTGVTPEVFSNFEKTFQTPGNQFIRLHDKQ
jgi:hypothetical protein